MSDSGAHATSSSLAHTVQLLQTGGALSAHPAERNLPTGHSGHAWHCTGCPICAVLPRLQSPSRKSPTGQTPQGPHDESDVGPHVAENHSAPASQSVQSWQALAPGAVLKVEYSKHDSHTVEACADA